MVALRQVVTEREAQLCLALDVDGASVCFDQLERDEETEAEPFLRAVRSLIAAPEGMVLLRTGIGGSRVLDMLVGDPLPRIC